MATICSSILPGLEHTIRLGRSWALDLFFPPDIGQLRTGRSSGINHEHFEPRQVVFEQGDLGDRICIIIKGSASILQKQAGASEPRRIATISARQYFGEMAMLHRAPRYATIECIEPMVVLSIEKGELASLMARLNELCDQFQSTAAARQPCDNKKPVEPPHTPSKLDGAT